MDRQHDRDRRAAALHAVDGERAAVQLDKRFRDGKTEARSAARFGELVFHLLERASELLEVTLWDADAGIGDRQPHALSVAGCRYRHATAGRRELHRVAQEVYEHLLERPIVAGHDQTLADVRHQRHFFLGGPRRDDPETFLDDCGDLTLL